MQEAALDRVRQELKRNRELIDKDGELLQEDELYFKLAEAANSITAKDNLIQVRDNTEFEIFAFSSHDILSAFKFYKILSVYVYLHRHSQCVG